MLPRLTRSLFPHNQLVKAFNQELLDLDVLYPGFIMFIQLIALLFLSFTAYTAFFSSSSDEYELDHDIIAENEEMPQPSTSDKNAVISLAMGYGIGIFETFIKSLRYTSCEADIILGVKGEILLQKEFPELFEKYHVRAIPWDLIQKETCDQESTIKSKSEAYGFQITKDIASLLCTESIGPELTRYVFYEQVVEHYVEPNGQVFIADFRDTFFQRDPFEHFSDYLGGAHLMAFEELDAEKLGFWDTEWIEKTDNYTGDPGFSFTTHWVDSCFGLDEKTKGQTVLCSGTIGGTAFGMKDYLMRYLAKIQEMMIIGDEQACILTKGVDQGYHNFLIYSVDWQFAVKIEKNAEGVVNTMGRPCSRHGMQFPLDEGVTVDPLGFALNVDKSRSVVLHQYDRCLMKNGDLYSQILSSKVLPLMSEMKSDGDVTDQNQEGIKTQA